MIGAPSESTIQISNNTEQQENQMNDMPQQQQQQQQMQPNPLCGIIFFTVMFKLLPLIFYISSLIRNLSEQYIFFVVGLLNGIDFWYTKNISGRFLAGLIWGSQVDETGKEKWYFEKEASEPNESKQGSKIILWICLGLSAICWGFYMIWAFLDRNEITVYICLIGFVLACTNLGAFAYCEVEVKKHIQPLIMQQFSSLYDKIMAKVVEMLKDSMKDIKVGGGENAGMNMNINMNVLQTLPNYEEIMKSLGKESKISSDEQ